MTTYNLTGKELFDAVMAGEYVPILSKYAEDAGEGCGHIGQVISVEFNRSTGMYEFGAKDSSGRGIKLYAASSNSKVTDEEPTEDPR